MHSNIPDTTELSDGNITCDGKLSFGNFGNPEAKVTMDENFQEQLSIIVQKAVSAEMDKRGYPKFNCKRENLEGCVQKAVQQAMESMQNHQHLQQQHYLQIQPGGSMGHVNYNVPPSAYGASSGLNFAHPSDADGYDKNLKALGLLRKPNQGKPPTKDGLEPGVKANSMVYPSQTPLQNIAPYMIDNNLMPRPAIGTVSGEPVASSSSIDAAQPASANVWRLPKNLE